MNVYDFDKTIYDGDSSMDFYKYNLKRDKSIIKFWPRQIKAALDYKRGKIDKTEMKTVFYEYFTAIPDMKKRVLEFWDEHREKIKPWYLEQKRDDDLIISASPEFMLEPICDELGIALIASVVDPRTGKNLKHNCWGAEKVARMEAHYDLGLMEAFYSDSYSDDPLAQYAEHAYLVDGDTIKPW
ncbi:haloacid dehalogenase-like hydrolase [Erysipelothrix rhusiopathiae]|uniref:haloacid dehalogenase-like hydrolase n=1 Tax=Erysipelothrix rhusiopathiae TaxID=1648 RepID=UPI000F42FD2B|nr:haloacid dehalogenase-like hydrolase [Erysipelothrix rhusiopathiae]AYV33958.1 phosphoserine phosphatase [Erysipelothrix rhusiopathiae]MDE8081560.1 haloacid dehalogenase-like hydrolase [Erysipelothrix rhusiopathiae]MDE8313933.1 haloacid dehalogenase-like hydrolase [Erysipelothrix rhusiopathiae]MDE8328784.1 haloacid dehalogenase-like hydrolase [Erysipelothrix rhusiopathiae]